MPCSFIRLKPLSHYELANDLSSSIQAGHTDSHFNEKFFEEVA
ncbi:hypothetical protein EBME_1572 [bacterium endosymbiont of Mortierella elongata FMR23-6]|nr:hypothetical protein EBME_1572 [bacterium endosymbiont of Mortierella elongata FMR23-6]